MRSHQQEPKCVLIELFSSLVLIRDGRSPQELDYWIAKGGEVAGPIPIPGTPADTLFSSVSEMVSEFCSPQVREKYFAQLNKQEIQERMAAVRARKRIAAVLNSIGRLQNEFKEIHQMLGGRAEGVVSVPDRLKAAADALVTQGKPVFDQKDLLKTVSAEHPEESEKVKRGLYPAITALIKRGVIKRVPGGFSL